MSNVEAVYPLAPLQEGLLFHAIAEPESGAYVNQLGFALRGPLDADAFVAAWQLIVRRHAVLRTAFAWKRQKRPVQTVLRDVRVPVERLDWRALATDERARRLERHLEDDRRRGFVLTRAPLLRVALIALEDDLTYVLKTHHHLVLDGWSSAIVRNELVLAYAAYARGTEPELPEPCPYRDYVTWVRRRDVAAAEAYWREELCGLRESPSPPRSGGSPETGFGEVTATLDVAVTARLGAYARAHGVTLNTVLQGAWALLLARTSGARDVIFGTTVSGRPPELPHADRIVGLLINTQPLRARLAPGACLSSFLRDLQRRAAAARELEHVPLAQIQAWAEVERGRPLFESVLVFENYPVEPPPLAGGGSGTAVGAVTNRQATHYPLSLIVLPRDELQLLLIHDGRAYDDVAARGLLAALETILRRIGAGGDPPLGEIELAPRPGTLRGLEPLEDGAGGLTARIAHRAAATPGAIAVRDGGGALTYAELETQATALARRLRRAGVAAETRVAILLARSPRTVMTLLAVLKAGGVYVPLDPDAPAARLAEILADSGACLIVSDGAHASHLPATRAPVLLLDADEESDHQPRAASVEEAHELPHVAPDQLAYVVYTSGSTGRPKGVAVTHRAILRLVAEPDYVHLGVDSVVGHASSLAFDAATFELWAPLVHGATIVALATSDLLDADALARRIAVDGIDTMFLTTALAQQWARQRSDVLRRLRTLLFGGEAVDPAAVRGLLAVGGPARLVHVYGPTETTTFATAERVATVPEDTWTVPIGAPIVGTELLVLDGWGGIAPPGVVGELGIGGGGLARGYLAAPGATAERFVPHPVPDAPGARLYRSGDLVRAIAGGRVEFVGRVDGQVKLRGFRIEPGEIEAALRTHPDVRDAVVVVREHRGDRRLAGFVVGTPHLARDADPGATLRAYLAAKLPGYMVPATVDVLDALPLGGTGKVDRRKLAQLAAGAERAETRGSEAPRTRLEQIVADIWCELLDLPSVGMRDDFFDLGGHSILAVQVVERIRMAVGGEAALPLTAIFQARTVAELAAALAGQALDASPIVALKTGGRQAPLYCFHPAGGHVTGYRRLADRMERDLPVYGVQARSLLDPARAEGSIEAMAHDYARALRAQTPQGPYRLLGWSMGGVLALAVAHLLETERQVVDFVGLVDVSLRVRAEGGGAGGSLVDRYAGLLGAHPEHEALRALDEGERTAMEASLAALASDEERLAHALAYAYERGLLSRNVSLDVIRLRSETLARAARLVNEHAVARVRAPLHVWIARPLGGAAPRGALEQWAAVTDGSATLRFVAGDHASIVESEDLASGVRDALMALRRP